MQDTIIKGTGNSHTLKSVANFMSLYPTYDAFATALVAGTLPVDISGLVAAGVQQQGMTLTKANLLSDATASALGLTGNPTVDDALRAAGPTYMEVITISGTWKAPFTGSVKVICVGGGGGGGNGGSVVYGVTGGGGGGGGSGKIVTKTVSVTKGTSYSCTIGKGGASGAAGGTTSFGTLASAAGGGAGGAGASYTQETNKSVGGAGGTGQYSGGRGGDYISGTGGTAVEATDGGGTYGGKKGKSKSVIESAVGGGGAGGTYGYGGGGGSGKGPSNYTYYQGGRGGGHGATDGQPVDFGGNGGDAGGYGGGGGGAAGKTTNSDYYKCESLGGRGSDGLIIIERV